MHAGEVSVSWRVVTWIVRPVQGSKEAVWGLAWVTGAAVTVYCVFGFRPTTVSGLAAMVSTIGRPPSVTLTRVPALPSICQLMRIEVSVTRSACNLVAIELASETWVSKMLRSYPSMVMALKAMYRPLPL